MPCQRRCLCAISPRHDDIDYFRRLLPIDSDVIRAASAVQAIIHYTHVTTALRHKHTLRHVTQHVIQLLTVIFAAFAAAFRRHCYGAALLPIFSLMMPPAPLMPPCHAFAMRRYAMLRC